MQSMVEEWLGMELYQLVSTHFAKFGFFGLSDVPLVQRIPVFP